MASSSHKRDQKACAQSSSDYRNEDKSKKFDRSLDRISNWIKNALRKGKGREKAPEGILTVHVKSDQSALRNARVMVFREKAHVATKTSNFLGNARFKNVTGDQLEIQVLVPTSALFIKEDERAKIAERVPGPRRGDQVVTLKTPFWFSAIIHEYKNSVDDLENRNADATLSKFWKYAIENLYDLGLKSRLKEKTIFRQAIEIPSKAILDNICAGYLNEPSVLGRLLALKKARKEDPNADLGKEIITQIEQTLTEYFEFIFQRISDKSISLDECERLENQIKNFYWEYDTRYVFYIQRISQELVAKAKENLENIAESVCYLEAARLVLDLNKDLRRIQVLRELLSDFSKIPPQ